MLKRISGILLSIIMVFSFAVPSFAFEDNCYGFIQQVKLYENPEDENSYLMYIDINSSDYHDKAIDFSENGKFFRITENGERELIKEFNSSDNYLPEWEYALVQLNQFIMSVDKNVIAEGGEYAITLPEQKISHDGITELMPVEVVFSYDDLLGGDPVLLFWQIEVERMQETDLKDFIIIPVGYQGDVMIETFSTLSDRITVTDNTKVYLETEDNVRIYLSDSKGSVFAYAELINIEDKADDFGELIKYSGDKLFSGGINALFKGGEMFCETVAIMFYPLLIVFGIPLSILGF